MPPTYYCSSMFLQQAWEKYQNYPVHPHIPGVDKPYTVTHVNVEDTNMIQLSTISNEVKAVFEDPDFERNLKILASEFGEDTSLAQVNFWFQQSRPVPEKLVDGKRYVAGYRGARMVSEGKHSGKLIQIRQEGNFCKLMFAVNGLNVFLYHNIAKDKVDINQTVNMTKAIGEIFPIEVNHETVPQTGDRHAVIVKVNGLDEIRKSK